MDIGSLLQSLGNNTVTATAIYGAAILSIVDFLTGITKALSIKGDGIAGTSFKFTYVGAWAGAKGTKLINIIVVLIAGAAMPDVSAAGISIDPIATLGIGWAATFSASLVSSIKQNVDPSDRTAVPEEVASGKAG